MMNTTDSAFRIWRDGQIVPGRIELAREQKGLPQQCVANVCGTDAMAVDLWEQGVEYPSWAEVEDLCAVLEVGLDFLARPVSGPRGLFTVPEGQEGAAELLLMEEYCEEAVETAVFGWPESLNGARAEAFA